MSTTTYLHIALVVALALSITLPVGPAPWQSVAQATHTSAIAVNTTIDENTADGDCSLREAIRAANLDIPIDACGAGDGADTIHLPSGTYTLSLEQAGEDAAATGDLDIRGDLTITGAGAATTIIDGGALDRVFDIAGAFAVNIANLTIRNGNATLNGGGGIFNVVTTLTLTNVSISANVSSASGGGIRNSDGTLRLINSTISDNGSALSGGGIFNIGSNAMLTIVNSTISGNTAAGPGGGISASGGTIRLNNVTVANNTADDDRDGIGDGGGISIGGGVVNVSNTILGGNTDTGGQAADCAGALISQGYNLIQTIGGCAMDGNTTGNLIGLDPQLSPLQDNGGATRSHTLLAGSPAIDSGNPAVPSSGDHVCDPIDQRGAPRPQGAQCDIGAIENLPTKPPDRQRGAIYLSLVVLSLAPCNDGEENDTPEQAKPLTTIGGACIGSLIDDTQGQDDYYSIDLSGEQSVSIQLSHIPPGADYDLFLYPAGTYSNQTGQATEHITYTARLSGTYNIRVNKAIEAPEQESNTYVLKVVRW